MPHCIQGDGVERGVVTINRYFVDISILEVKDLKNYDKESLEILDLIESFFVYRTMPGPPVALCKGDNIIVDVINTLATESTSIHFHGKIISGIIFSLKLYIPS